MQPSEQPFMAKPPPTIIAANANDFWKELVDRFWEKSPMLLPQGAFSPLSAAEFFELIKAICAREPPPPELSLFVNGLAISPTADNRALLLVGREDHDFESYDQRLRRAGISDYMIRIGHLQIFDATLWNRVRLFLQPLCRRVGIPNEDITTGIFMGRYRFTPFGVHLDHQSALTFPIYGEKRIRTWPFEFGASHPELSQKGTRYERFKPDSVLLQAEPGGMMYWPSREWHIAEGDDRFVATWNISFWYKDDTLINHLGPLLAEIVAAAPPLSLAPEEAPTFARELPLPPDPTAGRDVPLPASWAQATRLLEHRFTPGRIARTLRRAWLKRVSASGFMRVPPPAALTLGDAQEVRGNPDFAILLEHDDDCDWLFANGHEVAIAAHPSWPALIERLNAGQWRGLRSLSLGIDEDLSQELLTLLLSLRAIECR
jgi:hypothetical protein